jgi:hypothetical protein
MSAGQATAGFSSSCTVTVNAHDSLFPAPSVAVQVTAVEPMRKAEPLGGAHATATPGQLSLTLAANSTTASHRPAAARTARSAGQEIAGFSLSRTVTVKAQVSVFPEASVAVQVTVVVPRPNAVPLAGSQATLTPGQLSDAAASKLTAAVHWPASVLTFKSGGQATDGFSLSVTVTANEQTASLPLPSVAVQVTTVTPTGKVVPLAGEHAAATPRQLSVALALKVTSAAH